MHWSIYWQYRLLRLLGKGTFGTVYLAEHLHDYTPAAVKVLHIPLTGSNDFRAFLKEARTMRLRHPHIVPLLDFDLSNDDLPYLVMAYADGGTLRDRYPTGSKLSSKIIDVYVQQLASALQYAHDCHVIHRDVKPENVLVYSDGTLQLSDFGIAKISEHASLSSQHKSVGTPAYAAPEQSEGNPCPASDQYALAIVVYEWLAGQRPFQGNPLAVMLQHRTNVPPSLCAICPDVSPQVEQVVFKALAKAPKDRFPTVTHFAQALHTALQEDTLSTLPLPYFTSESVSSTGISVSLPDVQSLQRGAFFPNSKAGQIRVAEEGTHANQVEEKPSSKLKRAQSQPQEPSPIFPDRKRRRTGLIIAIITLVLLLSGGGLFAAMNLSKIVIASSLTPTLTSTPIVTPTAINAAALSPSQLYDAVTSRPVFYSSNLSQQDNANWDEATYTNGGSCNFVNGVYEVTINPGPPANLEVCLENAFSFSDFAFQAQMTICSGANEDGGGLVFRATSGTIMYRLRIGVDGSYDLTSTNLNIARISSAIKPGLNQQNLLTIIAQGNLIFLYVNSQYIGQTSSSFSNQGAIGFMAASWSQAVDITFTDTEVWRF